MDLPEWQEILKLVTSVEKSLYPNPKDYKEYQELTLKYTFARGATELLAQVFSVLNSLDDRIKRLEAKKDGKKKLNIPWPTF